MSSRANAPWETTSARRNLVPDRLEDSAPDCSFSAETTSTRVARRAGATPNKIPDRIARAAAKPSTQPSNAEDKPCAVSLIVAKLTRPELVQFATSKPAAAPAIDKRQASITS